MPRGTGGLVPNNRQLTDNTSLCRQQSQIIQCFGTKLLQASAGDFCSDGWRQVLDLSTLSLDLCVEARLVWVGKSSAVDNVDGFESWVADFWEGWLAER